MTIDFKTKKPRQILLATDMSARCDRALDRAVQLSRDWQVPLTLVHAFEQAVSISDEPSWRRPQDLGLSVQTELEEELLELTTLPGISTQEVSSKPNKVVSKVAEGMQLALDEVGDTSLPGISARVVRGKPADVVLKVTEEIRAELILTGVKRDGIFEQAVLGDTVTELSRKAKVPVLVVKKRLRRPYGKIVIASDLSDHSRVALARTIDLFGPENIVLFHAAFAHFASRMDDRVGYESELRSDAIHSCKEFILSVAGAEAARQIEIVVEYGEPDLLLEQYVRDKRVDLVTVATQGRTGLLGVLLGSMATRILDSVPCDVLIVRS